MGAPINLRTPRKRPWSIIVLNDHGWISGGQAKIAIESALQLRGRGLDVCFIAGVGPIDNRLIEAGVECHTVGSADILSDPNRLRAAARGIWNAKAARVLAHCVAARDANATIIHVHGWAKSLSPSIGPVVTGSKAAHVYTLHEYFLACPNGGFYDYRSGEICRRRALGIDCLTTRCDSRSDRHKMWRVARQAVLWTAGRMPSGLREFIYLAPEQLEIMRPYASAEARWHYLPNPAGPQPQRRILAERNELFLFVGRLSPEKGAEVAAAAAKLAGVEIAFCGEGEGKDAVLRANPAATLAGWVRQDEVTAWMRGARCLVFPSLWYEGYPLVVADALRAGLPVMVSDSSVAASSVRHEVDGLHLPAGDVQAWATAMRALLSDEVVHGYSKAAFAGGRKLLDQNAYTDQLIGIYERALTRRHAADLRQEAPVQ